MRCFLKSMNARCLASNLKNVARHADLGRHADITRLYLQIRLGVYALLAGWLGQMRHAIPACVPSRPVAPVGSVMTSQGTGSLSQCSVERCDRRNRLPSFAFIAR